MFQIIQKKEDKYKCNDGFLLPKKLVMEEGIKMKQFAKYNNITSGKE